MRLDPVSGHEDRRRRAASFFADCVEASGKIPYFLGADFMIAVMTQFAEQEIRRCPACDGTGFVINGPPPVVVVSDDDICVHCGGTGQRSS